jgi:hypothetical protein
MAGNGRLTFLLRPSSNAKGKLYRGLSNFPGTIELSEVVIFAYPQPDGTLLLSIEKSNERHASPDKESP